MAIDVSVFGADLPAGTYTIGDQISLGVISGPAVVRSGRGTAILKRISSIMTSTISGSVTKWKIKVKNSDWIDPASSITVELGVATALDYKSGAVQGGHNCPLTPNSSWEVVAECLAGGTTTVANSIAAVIEIDYPQVSAITEPDRLTGFPTSIEIDETVTINAPGTITTSTWQTINVDVFKAGYQYALEKVEMSTDTVGSVVGFIAISNAAGMGGLTRIIPIANYNGGIRPLIEYASTLVKGPMDIKYLLFNNSSTSATTDTVRLIFDFVKRGM